MPWNGSSPNKTFTRTTGTYTGATAWAQEDAAGTKVVSTKFDTHDQDMATSLNLCLAKDGGNKPTANIDWGGFKILNLGTPTLSTDAVTKAYADAVLPADADYGDITVSSSGAAWTIDADAVITSKILDANVTKAKIENLADYTALGNVSGGAAAPAEVAILDEDDMASDSATSLVTQQSVKAYADAISANNVWTYINEYALSGETAPYEITGLSGWDAIIFEVMLKPSLDGDLYIQLGHGTTTWLTGSVYRWLIRGGRINSGGSVNDTTVGDWSDTQIDLTTLSAEATGDVPFIATVQFQNWSAVTYNRMCKFQSVYLASSPEFVTIEGGGELQDTTNALTAIRFGNSGGGTLSGTILAYGRNFA